MDREWVVWGMFTLGVFVGMAVGVLVNSVGNRTTDPPDDDHGGDDPPPYPPYYDPYRQAEAKPRRTMHGDRPDDPYDRRGDWR